MPNKPTPFRADLKPLDTLLFNNNPTDNPDITIQPLAIERLIPFKNHPFRLYGEEKMRDMAQSIAEHGVMTPLIVRPHPGGQAGAFEIISGHNRHEGARQAGLSEVPVIVRDVDDATAILMMISSNFEQRDELLPSEKAFAYRMQLDAIKHQGKKMLPNTHAATSAQLGQKLEPLVSRDIVAREVGESKNQISRYVRLTELIPPLMERVDSKLLPFVASVDLSYLTHSQQTALDELLTVEGMKTVSNAQAARMKEQSQDGTLDDIGMLRILHDKADPILASVKLTKRLQAYIPRDTLPKDAENLIISAMDIRSIALQPVDKPPPRLCGSGLCRQAERRPRAAYSFGQQGYRLAHAKRRLSVCF